MFKVALYSCPGKAPTEVVADQATALVSSPSLDICRRDPFGQEAQAV
jgi:hypothetical protein